MLEKDLLIRNGTIIDGTGRPGYKADLLIRDGRIVDIGRGLNPLETELIDATGALVTPGFIDSHTHFDPSLFWDPLVEMAQHGVTTVLIGNCSLGLAPLHKADVAGTSDLFAFIEDVPREIFSKLVSWDWETYPEYVTAMRRRPYAANVAALVSHSMLRQYVMGAAAWERESTCEEISRIADELEIALQAGALGMSSSFFDRDSLGRPVPSYYGDDAEYDRLFSVLGKHGALFQVIPRHSEGTELVCQDLERMGKFSSQYGVPMISNGIGDMPSQPESAPALLACARRINANGGRLLHLLSPRSVELLINPDQTMTFLMMPVWNGLIQADRPAKRGMLTDTSWRERARTEWDTVKSFLFPTDNLERIRIVAVGKTSNEPWVGRSLAELVAARGGHPADVFAEWLLENNFEARFVVPMNNFDPVKVGELARQPEVLLSASDAGAHFQMFCGVGDTTLVLTRHVRDRPDLTLENAVHKLTGEQATLLGLADRGVIRPGARADLAIFALDELEWKQEVMMRDLPGDMPRFSRPPGGFRFTLVNGIVVQQSGRDTGARPAEFFGSAHA